jgi:signal transduction histidine kinase
MSAQGPSAIARAFARRMLRVAALVGLFVAGMPPVLHALVSHRALAAQSEGYARSLSQPLSRIAARQPGVWPYNLHKIVQATASHRGLEDLGLVRVLSCDGRVLLDGNALDLGSGHASGPSGWAPVNVVGKTVAWIHVTSDARSTNTTTGFVALASSLLGAVLAAFLHLFSSRAVYRQAHALEDTLGRLAEAEGRLRASNEDLRERVHAAVSESRQLSEKVVSIQESERRRIAGDLHDSVGQLLTALQLALRRFMPSPQSSGEDNGAEARALCERSLQELRRVVRDLRPLELESAGLVEAIRVAAERFELRTGIPTSFRHQGGEVGADGAALCLFRVLQESLTNVARHAEADEVGIALAVDGQRATLDVWDSGRGFDPESTPRGTGLTSMAERVRFAGGDFRVTAQPGGGTRIRASLPLATQG